MPSREDRIRELKRRAEQASRGKMIAWESTEISPAQSEEFWRGVAEFETVPSTTDFQRLIDAGLVLPEPDALEDEHLLYFKYYADERERQQWLEAFPVYDMPAHQHPPYDRDRHLPAPC